MTNKELVEILGKYNPDLTVGVVTEEGTGVFTNLAVDLSPPNCGTKLVIYGLAKDEDEDENG